MALEEAGVKLIAEGSNAFGADMKSAEKAIADVGASAAKTSDLVQDAAGRWRTASGRFASDAEKAAAGVETIAPAADKAGTAAKRAGDDAEKGARGFDIFGEIVTGALRKVGEIAVDAFMEAGRATAAFLGDSIGLAGDFEAGMREFQVAAGKDLDTSGLEEFHDLFIQLGKDLPVSTSDVQQAAIELVKGGIDPATVAAGGLEQSIKFAAAAMKGDLVGAAEISSKIVGGWADIGATAAEKAELLTSATDTLTKAANASQVGVDDLSLGLFNMQGSAKAAGMGLDESVTALALLAPNFSSAATAGTSLNSMIGRLQPSTAPAIAAMTDLGLFTEETGSVFFDQNGKFIGWAETAEILQNTVGGLTDAQKQSTLQTIFGIDAMGAASELTRQGAEGYNAMTDSLANAMGVQEAAAVQQEGYNTALENAKGSWEALQLTIGEKVLPILTDLLTNVVAPAINTVTDFADAVFGSEDAFSRLSPELQIIVTVIDEVVDSVSGVIDAFDDAGAMSSEFGEAIGALADDLGLPGELIQDLVFGVQDLIAMFQDGGAASDDLGGAIDDLSGIWEKAGQVVENVLGGYQDIIDSVLPQVQQFIDEHGDEISAFFQEAWDSIVEIISLALDLYNEIVPPVLHAIAGFIDDHGSEIQRIFGAAWDTVSTLISGVLDTIKGVINIALSAIRGDWDGVWTGIEDVTKTITGTIGGVIEGFLNIIAGFFDTNLDEIVNLWQNNWDQLVDIATQTDWARVGRDVVDGIIAGLAGAWSSLVGWITDRMGSLVDQGLEAIGAGSPAKEWMPVGAFSVQGIMAGFSEQWPALTKLVDNLGDDLIQQAKDLGMSVQNAIGDAFGATASIDRQIARNLDALADNVLPEYQQFTQGALKMAEQQARAFLDPTEGARFFQLRSKQILEFAELQQRLAEEEDSDARARLQQQMNLINAAQTAELKQFESNLAGSESAIEQIMASMQAFLASKGTNAQGDEVSLPGILENSTIAALTNWLSQLTTPPANPWQQAGMSSSTTYNQQRQYTMPVYTNQSPEALQQSMALMGAMYP